MYYLKSSGSQKSKLTFAELKSRYQQARIPSGGSQGESCSLAFSSFQKSTAFLG